MAHDSEDTAFRSKVLISEMVDGRIEQCWEECRPIPQGDDWFENIWHDCRNGLIYE